MTRTILAGSCALVLWMLGPSVELAGESVPAMKSGTALEAGTPRLAFQGPLFRSGTQVVPIYATVLDSQGRLVPGLVQEDFRVLDNGEPQPITQFSNETLPITVVVMLDTSASMTLHLDLLKNASEQFLLRLLPEDRGRVGAFNDKIQFASEFTSDRDDLIASLRDLQFGNPTRLFDAVDASLDELRGVEGRRVVLVFTDGDDTSSQTGLRRVLERARDEEVMVYAIGLESEINVGGRRIVTRPDRGLKRLAEETGGGFFELDDTSALGPTFTRVAQELHSQYLIGFSPSNLDGKVHELEAQATKRGLTVRARRSYLARATGTGSSGE